MDCQLLWLGLGSPIIWIGIWIAVGIRVASVRGWAADHYGCDLDYHRDWIWIANLYGWDLGRQLFELGFGLQSGSGLPVLGVGLPIMMVGIWITIGIGFGLPTFMAGTWVANYLNWDLDYHRDSGCSC